MCILFHNYLRSILVGKIAHFQEISCLDIVILEAVVHYKKIAANVDLYTNFFQMFSSMLKLHAYREESELYRPWPTCLETNSKFHMNK